MSKTLFHLVGFLQFFYGCYYDYMYVKFSKNHSPDNFRSFGGKFKFLTFINAVLLTVYCFVALLNDLIGTNEAVPREKPLIRKIRDIVFSALIFPLSMFVAVTFWGIYAVDRELVLPKVLDSIFPVWLNHVMHTNIAIFVMIDLLTSFRMYPKRKNALSLLTTFMLFYMVWLHIVYYYTGSWVYPILAVMNWPVRIVFYLFSLVLVFGLYFLGDKLNNTVWSKEIEYNVKSGKKKVK